MKTTRRSRKFKHRQHGLSLVELMIGLTIGLVIVGATSALFLDVSRNYRMNSSIARMQENARFSFDKIGRSSRSAGYFGCANQSINNVENTLLDKSSYLYNFTTPIQGFEGSSDSWTPVLDNSFSTMKAYDEFSPTSNIETLLSIQPLPGTDVLTLRGLPDENASPIVKTQPNGANLTVTDTTAVAPGDIVMIVKCNPKPLAAIFQVTGVQPDNNQNGFTVILHQKNQPDMVPGNDDQKIDSSLVGGELMQIETSTYFIGNNPYTNRPGLFFWNGKGPAIQIASNVENMQILYGVDDGLALGRRAGDRIVDRYLPANLASSDWTQIRSIQIEITLISEDNNLATAETKDTDNDGVPDVNDGHLRYVASSTFALRNRLP